MFPGPFPPSAGLRDTGCTASESRPHTLTYGSISRMAEGCGGAGAALPEWGEREQRCRGGNCAEGALGRAVSCLKMLGEIHQDDGQSAGPLQKPDNQSYQWAHRITGKRFSRLVSKMVFPFCCSEPRVLCVSLQGTVIWGTGIPQSESQNLCSSK